MRQSVAWLTPAWVVVGLAMGPAVSLGLARFAYALLLPAMRAELGWSFANAGAMNAANAAGYLLGALMAAPLGRRWRDKRVFGAALVATALAVGASGLTTGFAGLAALRFLAGLTGALAFVCGAGLASAAATGGADSRAPTLLAVYFSGAGVGVAASALAIPPLLDRIGWRGGWLVLGALGLAASAFGLVAARRARDPAAAPRGAPRDRWSPRVMTATLVAYGLFGVGYIAYATFIVAFLRGEEGFSPAAVTVFWTLFGLSSIAAAFAWGPILARLKGGWGTAATLSLVMAGTATPLLWRAPAGAYVSAILFGGSFLAVLAAVTSFARRAVEPHAWTASIATLTVAFGAGQCIGPVLSGALSDGANGLRAGLWLSACVLMIAACVATLQREPRERQF